MSKQTTIKNNTNPTALKLPKLAFKKLFRVRSASKDKQDNYGNNMNSCVGRENYREMVEDNGKEDGEDRQKYRSSSLKMSKNSSKKSLNRKGSTDNSSQQDNNPPISQHPILTPNTPIQTLQKQHQQNLQKLSQIAKLFDPNTLMKLGHNNKATQNSQSQLQLQLQSQSSIKIHKQNKHRLFKDQLRINYHIFQGKHIKYVKTNMKNININMKEDKGKAKGKGKVKGALDDQEYWRKVNQSLILGGCKIENQGVSKEFQEIYQTLVTE